MAPGKVGDATAMGNQAGKNGRTPTTVVQKTDAGFILNLQENQTVATPKTMERMEDILEVLGLKDKRHTQVKNEKKTRWRKRGYNDTCTLAERDSIHILMYPLLLGEKLVGWRGKARVHWCRTHFKPFCPFP